MASTPTNPPAPARVVHMKPVYTDSSYPSASAYLEHYLESVESLPQELQRNFTQLREIDARTQSFVSRLEKLGNTDLTALYHLDPTERAHRLADLQSLLETCLQYGMEKDRLAAHTFELVDQHIRKLDHDLEQYELECKEGKRVDKPAAVKRPAPPSNREKAGGGGGGGGSSGPVASRPPAKKPKKEKPPTPSPKPPEQKKREGKEDMVDDTKYCICEQVSYGEMVGCDNDDCPVEWFHFTCVGLTAKPKGKWYCSECRETMTKGVAVKAK